MPKQPFDDIVPRRSIRSVNLKTEREESRTPIHHTKTRARQREVERVEIEEEEEETPKIELKKAREEFSERVHRPSHKKNTKRSFQIISTALLVVVVAIVGVVIANALGSATLNITPKTASVDFKSEQFTITKNGGAQDIVFQPLVIKKTSSVVVRSTGEKQVNDRASGTIVIYNNHTTSSQRLIKNTRFETPKGLIFRIDQSITVPGKTGTVPGSVEAKIYADEPGDSYNVDLSDFTIPGFKGDTRYKDFYARSKTPITGGFSGTKKVVSDSDRLTAKQKIESEVKSSLVSEASSKIPEGYILFDNAMKIEWRDIADESLDADQVRITEEGTLTAALIPTKSLAVYLARRSVDGYKNEPVYINNLKDLTIALVKSDAKPGSDSLTNLTITGKAQFVWSFDEMAIKQSFVGIKKDAFNETLNKFSESIAKGSSSISPFWKSNFPEKTDKIKLNIEIPN